MGAEKLQASIPPVSTLKIEFIGSKKGCRLGNTVMPAGGCNSKDQHLGLEGAATEQLFVILQQNPSLFLSLLLLSPSFHFLFFFTLLLFFYILGSTFLPITVSGYSGLVEQQQMHNEMYRLGNELRRVRGRVQIKRALLTALDQALI